MQIDRLDGRQGSLVGLGPLNVIMGRNGSGKSRFMRGLDAASAQNPNYNIRYISPERAGTFKRDGIVITNMENDVNWLRNVRDTNQAANFKSASAVLLREAESIYNRKILETPALRDDHSRSFAADRLSLINSLLTNVTLATDQRDFEFFSMSGERVAAEGLSSGESEAVALATEILYFFDTVARDKFNVLLIDEPDVHLHPDLQARLAHLIVRVLDEFAELADRIAVCISTHSAPLVCALATSLHTQLGTKSFGVDAVQLSPASDQLRKIAPFFGHPLSLALSADVAIIVEGEDDERVWQQAARSSLGRIKLFPVLATSVDQQSELEKFAKQLLGNLYDTPLAFSLRDGDGKTEALQHELPVRRHRFACYAIENMLLTDDCLKMMGTDWAGFVQRAEIWLAENPSHKDRDLLGKLIGSKDRLRNEKIKSIRVLVCAICGVTKPWEVVVGQSIAAIAAEAKPAPNSLLEYFGEIAFREIIFREI